MRAWWIGLVAVASSIAACDEGGDGKAHAAAASETAAPSGSSPRAEAPEPHPDRPARIRYDLAGHVHRAELFQGDVQVMDFGVPGGAKHFLGGWQTMVGDDVEVDGVRAVTVPGVTARWTVWAEDDGAAVLTLRGRAPGDGRVAVYVDGETVANVKLPTDTFGLARVELEPGTLEPGMRLLQVRVPRTGWVEGAGKVGLLVDWMRLGPADDPEPPSPPGPDALVRSAGDGPSLSIPRGWSLAYAFEVPEGARLRGRVRGSPLRVRLFRDGRAPAELATVEAGQPLDADLAAHAGEVVRVHLEAEEDDVVVRRPAVVTLDGGDARRDRVRPTHVLVYLIDTLRADKLAPYNPQTRVETPGFTRHAESAALFEQGLAQENWTKPSVATLLSSLMPWEHHATTDDAVLPASVRILPEVLKSEGFFTGAFIANGFVSNKFGFGQGWDTFRNYIREGRRTQARFVAADVLQWLDQRPEDDPFFLYVHTIDPHVPYIPPDEILERYDPGPYDGPVDFTRDRELLEKIKVGSVKVDDRDRRRLEALYDGEITYHDVHFASIMDGLDRRGLMDETMVVVTADHGEELFDHGSVGHGHSQYQELLHVPLTIHVPGLTDAGVRVAGAVGLVDVMPTILDALGMEPPDALRGRSLLPLIRGHVDSAPRIATSSFMHGWRTVVVGHRKLVHRTHARAQVYDLAEDPAEQQDVAAERPLAARYLQGLLGLALRGETGSSDAHDAERTDIDPETEAQLRALGYVGTSRR